MQEGVIRRVGLELRHLTYLSLVLARAGSLDKQYQNVHPRARYSGVFLLASSPLRKYFSFKSSEKSTKISQIAGHAR